MGGPAIFGGNRYLVPFNGGIATTSVRTGLAMTALFIKHQFVGKLRKADKYIRRNSNRTSFFMESFFAAKQRIHNFSYFAKKYPPGGLKILFPACYNGFILRNEVRSYAYG